MYKRIYQFLFFFKAQTAHGLHSPLVFDLYMKVINPNLWPYHSKKIYEEIQKFISSKLELKDFNLLIINNLNDLSSLEIKKKQVIFINDTYQNKEFKKGVDHIANNVLYNYVIHFFKGSILISSDLAPKQIFYLKHMQ